jgi:hypothetical protein
MTPRGIIIHCADTPNGSRRYTPADIDAWHGERGFDRGLAGAVYPHIGYHYVIDVDGVVHLGRDEDEVGAHCRGHNDTLGICLLGRDKFTLAQWHSLRTLVMSIAERLPLEAINGHRDFNDRKDCPGFGVHGWLLGGMAPLDQHVIIGD